LDLYYSFIQLRLLDQRIKHTPIRNNNTLNSQQNCKIMKKSVSKLIVFSAIIFIASMSSCKTGGGYGCDYTEAVVPDKSEVINIAEQTNAKHSYKMTKDVSE